MVSLGGPAPVAAPGDYTAMTYHGFILDLESGDRERLFETECPASIGRARPRETGLLLVPDAEVGVRLFDVTDDEVTPSDEITLDAALPAHAVRAIRP